MQNFHQFLLTSYKKKKMKKKGFYFSNDHDKFQYVNHIQSKNKDKKT